MALQTPVTTVPQTDTFDQWRVKTNSVITQSNQTVQDVGDISTLTGGQTNLVQAVNDSTDFSIAISIALG
jgi:thiamine pyrophosphokinase